MFIKMMTLCFVAVYGAISTSIFLPDYPFMKIDLAMQEHHFYYCLTMYLIGAGLGHLALGACADQFGRLKALKGGQITFAFAVFLSGLTSCPEILVFARFFQGFGSSVGPTIANTICRDLFTGKDLTRAIALIFMAMTLAPVFAPLIGSYVRHLSSWRGNFYFMGVFAILTFILCIFSLKGFKDEPNKVPFHKMFSNYGKILVENKRLFFIFGCFFGASGGFFSFITSANYMFIEHYKISVEVFPRMLSIAAISSFFGMLFLRYLANKIDIKTLANLVFFVGFVGVLSFFLNTITGDVFEIFFLTICFYLSVTAAIAVICTSEALAECKMRYSAGHVAALLGSVQLFSGAIISHFLRFFTKTPQFMSLILFSLLTIAWVFHRIYIWAKKNNKLSYIDE